MKFTSYTSQVQSNTIQGGVSLPAMENPVKGFSSLAAGLTKMGEAMERDWENRDKVTLMKAMGDMDKSRYDYMYGEQGIMSREMGAANGIGTAYNKDMEEARDKILGQYKFKTDLYRQAFIDMADRANYADFKKVDAHERKQLDNEKNQLLNDGINTISLEAQKNYKDPEAFQNSLSRAALTAGLRYSGDNYSKEQAIAAEKKARGIVAEAAINAALADDDPYRAQEIYDNNYFDFDQGRAQQLGAALKTRVKNKKMQDEIDNYYQRYGGNIAAISKALEQDVAKGGKEDFLKAVATQESGGNYEAENDRTGAYGKYQIMPENWPAWAKEAGLPEGAKMTPENQEKVVRHKLGGYFDKYGVEGALVAWYAGEQNGKRWAEGKSTWIDENGNELPWNYKFEKNEPSVREYVEQAVSHMGGSTIGTEQKNKILEGCMNKAAQQQRLKHMEDNQLYDSVWTEFFTDRDNGTPYEEVMKKVNKYAAGDGEKYLKLRDIANSLYNTSSPRGSGGGASGGSGQALSDAEVYALAELIKNNKAFADFRVGLDFVSKKYGGSLKAIAKYKQLYDQRERGEGVFQYDLKGLVKNAIPKATGPAAELAERRGRITAVAFINEYRLKSNGKDPSSAEVMNAIRKGMTEINYGTYKDWDGDTDSLKLTPAEVLDSGIRTIAQGQNGLFVVTYKDGRVESMSGEALRAKVRGE